jgi:excinuclease Cho
VNHAWLTDGLPRTPGVYLFHGEGSLPLYVGKSVNIRARVQSHLRDASEARMMAQTLRVEVIETAGELGALLLESHLIKTLSPLFNQRLRRVRRLCTIQLLPLTATGSQVTLADERTAQLGVQAGLFGLFASRHAAREKLHSLALQHRLCLQRLGLEPPNARGCFGWQTKQCSGVCVGHESPESHAQRLEAALAHLQVHTWPFAGAVDLVETRDDWVQKHRLHQWAHLGTWCSREGRWLHRPTRVAGFDTDSYHIVLKPVLLQTLPMEAVSESEMVQTITNDAD